MGFVLDLMHIVAATLLALVGLGYEREEDCAPVHFEPAAYVVAADDEADAEARFIQTVGASDCDSRDVAIVYPVL
jgi:hypothetical protein